MTDPSAESFWERTAGPLLAQGDYLPHSPTPVFPPAYGTSETAELVAVEDSDVIVVTQSCDLENSKVAFVVACPIYTIAELGQADAKALKSDYLERIRKGALPALHMLSSPDDPADNRKALVVDFREFYSIPVKVLESHAATIGPRWRLRPPYLEHFSQALARFFMRVGLPSAIPKFK